MAIDVIARALALKGVEEIKDAKEYIEERIRANPIFDLVIVSELPETGKNNIIYLLVESTKGLFGRIKNTYTEYIWVEELESFEQIGSASLHLENYALVEDFNAFVEKTEQDVIDLNHKIDTKVSTIIYVGTELPQSDYGAEGDVYFQTLKEY
jgi:hypothetical protein